MTEIPWVPLLLARALRDGEAVHLGAGQETAQVAVSLAVATGLQLRVAVAGARLLAPGSVPGNFVGSLAFDWDVLERADRMFDQARYFDRVRDLPVVMGSGFQIDARGNLNLVGVRDGSQWKVKGPGMAGLPSLTGFAHRLVLYLEKHDRRRLVPESQFVSVVGDPQERDRLGLSRATDDGCVITPLGVFRWDSDGFLSVWRSRPGVPWDDLAANTGFPLRRHSEFEVSEAPTTQEADAYQQIIKHGGVEQT